MYYELRTKEQVKVKSMANRKLYGQTTQRLQTDRRRIAAVGHLDKACLRKDWGCRATGTPGGKEEGGHIKTLLVCCRGMAPVCSPAASIWPWGLTVLQLLRRKVVGDGSFLESKHRTRTGLATDG
jgi:hypothetical protein